MSSTVDNRVVAMHFENKDFEKGVSESVKSIDNLKKSLDMKAPLTSFGSMIPSLVSSLFGIGQGVDAISSRFSVLGIMGVTALQNITNAAINAGIEIVKSLTITPISTGFNEYEQKMGIIQTLIAGTGESLESVNMTLDDLNAFSDTTIYSFKDMYSNMVKFTNNGVALDLAAESIKGIALVAAVSGANVEQAGMAFYNLGQAVGQGSVKLRDWMSVELAGMATTEFKQTILDTAVAMGTLTKQADGTYKTLKGSVLTAKKGFREALSDEFFTTEVLTTTLAKYGDAETELGKKAIAAAQDIKTFSQWLGVLKESAQSGWAATWEILVGDFEEAKTLLTDLNNVIGKMIGDSANSRNELLKTWKEMGGRKEVIQALANVFKYLFDLLKPIGEAMREIFPPVTVFQLKALSEGFLKFSENLKANSRLLYKIKRIAKGFFAALDIGRMFIVAVATAIGFLANKFSYVGDWILNAAAKVGDFIVQLRNAIKESNFFINMFSILGYAIGQAFGFIQRITKSTIDKVKEFFAELKLGVDKAKQNFTLDGPFKVLDEFLMRLRELFPSLDGFIEFARKVIGFFSKVFAKVMDFVGPVAAKIRDGVAKLIEAFFSSFARYTPDDTASLVNKMLFGGILLAIQGFINNFGGIFRTFSDAIEGTVEIVKTLGGISGVLNEVKDTLKAYQASLKADVLMKIATAIAILAVSIIALSMVDPGKLKTALSTVTVMLTELFIAMATFKSSVGGVPTAIALATSIVGISLALIIFAGAIAILGRMDPEEMALGLKAVAVLMGELIITSRTMGKATPGLLKSAIGILAFSFALAALVKPIAMLGGLDPKVLGQGLEALAYLLAEVAGFMLASRLGKSTASNAIGMVLFAGAIIILIKAVEMLGIIEPAKLEQGLKALGLIVLGLSAFINSARGVNPASIAAAGVSVVLLAGAIYILTLAMEKLSQLSTQQLSDGLMAIGAGMAIMVAALLLIPKDALLSATSILIISGALFVMAQALTLMAKLSWDEVGRGLTVLGGSMLILAVGLNVMQNAIGGALALALAAAGLALLAPALILMSKMSWEEIGKGLLMLAGVFLVIGLAGLALTPVVPSLLGLGVALLLIGAGAAAAGLGLLAFSAGLAALSVSGAAGSIALGTLITTLANTLPLLGVKFAEAILGMISTLVKNAPVILAGMNMLIGTILSGLITNIPKIVEVISVLIMSIITRIAEDAPKFIEAGYSIIKSILGGLRNNIGEITTIGYDIILEFLAAVTEKLPEVIDAGWKLLIALIDGFSQSVEENMPTLITKLNELGANIVIGLVEGMFNSSETLRAKVIELGQIIIDQFKQLLGIESPSTVFIGFGTMIIQGLLDGFTAMAEALGIAVGGIVTSIVTAFTGKYEEFIVIGSEFLTRLKTGLLNKKEELLTEFVTLITDVKTKFTDEYEQFKTIGKNIVEGIAKGVKDYTYIAITEVWKLADSVLKTIKKILGIKSPSKETTEDGRYLVEGLANGIDNYAYMAITAMSNLGKKTLSGFRDTVDAVKDFAASNIELNPVITPVLDLSAVEKDGKLIGGLVNTGYEIPLKSQNLAIDANTSMLQNQNGSKISEPRVLQKETQIQFTQNNYSPKALSRFEIHRQTRNQLLLFKQVKGVSG